MAIQNTSELNSRGDGGSTEPRGGSVNQDITKADEESGSESSGPSRSKLNNG